MAPQAVFMVVHISSSRGPLPKTTPCARRIQEAAERAAERPTIHVCHQIALPFRLVLLSKPIVSSHSPLLPFAPWPWSSPSPSPSPSPPLMAPPAPPLVPSQSPDGRRYLSVGTNLTLFLLSLSP